MGKHGHDGGGGRGGGGGGRGGEGGRGGGGGNKRAKYMSKGGRGSGAVPYGARGFLITTSGMFENQCAREMLGVLGEALEKEQAKENAAPAPAAAAGSTKVRSDAPTIHRILLLCVGCRRGRCRDDGLSLPCMKNGLVDKGPIPRSSFDSTGC